MKSPNPVILKALLDSINIQPIDSIGNLNTVVTGISTHAQSIRRSELFVAISGTKTDSHQLISEAVERGAAAVMVERPIPSYPGVTIVQVPNTRLILGPLAHGFFGNPAESMRIAAVTGTNGKTTTTTIIAKIMACAGFTPGIVGTLGVSWGNQRLDENITTPGPLKLAEFFYQMKMDGVDMVSMEASSHGIDQARLAGIPVHAGALTNVSQDHLDYHGDFPTYIATKRRLFFDYVAKTQGGVACLNADDPVGEELCFSYPGEKISFSTALHTEADIVARNIRFGVEGTEFNLLANGSSIPVSSRLIGSFNLTNTLAAAAVCHALGVDLPLIAEGVAQVPPVAGRFETVRAGQPFLTIVDYAHTPDALEKVLRTARQLTAGRLITVFGCGGDRDRTKRAPMGKAVGSYSDYAIVTSDNPRNEDPDRIARDAYVGLEQSPLRSSQYQIILDRAHAIERALHLAAPGDCVMICGKGHETYQEIHGKKYAFDDRQIAREILKTMTKNWATAAHPMTTENQIA